MINIPNNFNDLAQVRAFALSQAVRCATGLGQPVAAGRYFERPDADIVVRQAAIFERYINEGEPKHREEEAE